MLILYTIQRCSTTREVITTALYCKHWSYSPGMEKVDKLSRRLYMSILWAPSQGHPRGASPNLICIQTAKQQVVLSSSAFLLMTKNFLPSAALRKLCHKLSHGFDSRLNVHDSIGAGRFKISFLRGWKLTPPNPAALEWKWKHIDKHITTLFLAG